MAGEPILSQRNLIRSAYHRSSTLHRQISCLWVSRPLRCERFVLPTDRSEKSARCATALLVPGACSNPDTILTLSSSNRLITNCCTVTVLFDDATFSQTNKGL